jgi:hypothetical protein
MSTALKCPNPNCSFLFDPTQVPQGAILSCPQCAMRFTLGPPASPPASVPSGLEASRPHAGVSSNVPNLEMAQPRPPEQPISPTIRRRRVESTPFPWGTLLGIFAVFSTALVLGYLLVTQIRTNGNNSQSTTTYEDRNISYRFPVSNWEKDEETRTLLSGNLFGLRRIDGSTLAALEARDYKTRNPQIGELREGMSERLKLLLDDLDLREVEGAMWAGQPALRTIVRGNATAKLGAGVYVGEVYAMASKGVGYWFVAISPESQGAALSEEINDLLERMKLLNFRATWKESTSATYTLVGREVDYRLSDGDGWWKALSDPQFEDPNADQVFDAEFQSKTKRDFKPRARAAVLVLPSGNETPLATLKAYLQKSYEKQLGLKTWEEIAEPPLGDWPASGEQRGAETVRYRVLGQDANTTKLVVLSAMKVIVNTKEGMQTRVVGVHLSCPIEYQSYWEKRLIQLASSIREAAK